MKRTPLPRHQSYLTLALLFLGMISSAQAGDVILQYFEGRWDTIERRMPDVFMAGYNGMWVPPASRADSGGYSVGYDVYNRFDLGSPFGQTLYGTEAGLRYMLNAADRAGISVYADVVLNHNGFRDGSSVDFEAYGGYPGFVTSLPEDVDGDFHGAFEGGVLNERTAGLIDIAQEKNHVFIRHPVEVGNPLNIPNETPRAENRRYYPDTDFNSPAELGDTSGDRHTPSGFNLDRPEAGDPYAENATGLLARSMQYYNEVLGFEGFRIDAQKHIPQWFFDSIYDPAIYQKGNNGTTPFSFGETFDTNFGLLSSYTRKDGYGNRDVLDFPLYYAMQDVFNAGGFGDMRNLEFASFDSSDGNANDGSRGVMFVQSHDSFAPASDNIAYAHILTRTGYPIVYFNAYEFGDGRDFPKGGRGDALGGQYGDILTTLVDINRERARSPHVTRYADADTYIYERSNALLVGLNDNGSSALTRNLTGLDFRNITLTELTGNAGASASVSVDGSGNASVTIPANGYAIWGPTAPRGHQTLAPFELSSVSDTLAADPPETPNSVRRLTPIEVVTADSVDITLRIQPEGLDNHALLRIDDGSVDITGTAYDGGSFPSHQVFANASPSATAGTGIYSSTLDLTQLDEGVHYLEALAFLERTAGLPTVYESFRKVIYVDRLAPQVSLAYPGQTGTDDVLSREYDVVIKSDDATANAVYVLPDFVGDDSAALAAISESNRASKVDRDEFRFTWEDISTGLHELTVVTLEETGNASVTRFGNIAATVATPAVTFENLPALINSSTYNDIELWVETTNALGGDDYTFDPEGGAGTFSLELTIDGVTYPAQAYSEGVVGSVNTLYQNDYNLGDEFDVFRLHWRGYGAGFHTFEARAELNDGAFPASEISKTVQVANDTPGPDFTITNPLQPENEEDPPTTILVAPDTIAVSVINIAPETRSIQAFYNNGIEEERFAHENFSTAPSTIDLISDPGQLMIYNGVGTIRVVSSTASDGGGIVNEKSTRVLVIGTQDQTPSGQPITVDGQDNDWTGLAPSTIHTTALSGDEWIYTGEVGDARTDLGDDTDIGNTSDAVDYNFDITELRMRASAEHLFFLLRVRELNATQRASFAMGLDVDAAGTLNFIGDESQTELDTAGRSWDYSIQVHFTTNSYSRVEIYDDVGDPIWFSPDGEQSYFGGDHDLIEFSIPRSSIGLDGESLTTIAIQGATFENQLFDLGGPETVGWNNDVDSTRDITGSQDALDVLGGEPGVSENAYFRAAFDVNDALANADPNVVLTYEIDVAAPGDIVNFPPPTILSVTPDDAHEIAGTNQSVMVMIETDNRAGSVIVAIGGRFVLATLVGENGGNRQWEAQSPGLSFGDNRVDIAAFSNSNMTGQSDLQTLTYRATQAQGWHIYE